MSAGIAGTRSTFQDCVDGYPALPAGQRPLELTVRFAREAGRKEARISWRAASSIVAVRIEVTDFLHGHIIRAGLRDRLGLA